MTTWTPADTDALAELTHRKAEAIKPLACLVQQGLVTDHNTSLRIAEVLITNAAATVQALAPFLRAAPIKPIVKNDTTLSVMLKLDDYLRAIRSEELDGSEPELEELLERSRSVWENANERAKPTVDEMREKATILAALRQWQRLQDINAAEYYIATDGGTLDPLDSEEIDALCERINTTN